MKSKAAVCYEAGKELVIETVDLEGPKFGEVLVEIKASGRILASAISGSTVKFEKVEQPM